MKELSLHILDILENSAEAGATRVTLLIEEDETKGKLRISVSDNGRGMSPEELEKAFDPFYTSRATRRVGLGLPLFFETCKRCNGRFKLDSSPGRGTVVKATFQLGHVDLPPMGDLGGTVIAFLAGHPDISFRYVHRINGDEFLLDTDELKENLEVEELTDPIIMKFLREKIGDVLSSNSVV